MAPGASLVNSVAGNPRAEKVAPLQGLRCSSRSTTHQNAAEFRSVPLLLGSAIVPSRRRRCLTIQHAGVDPNAFATGMTPRPVPRSTPTSYGRCKSRHPARYRPLYVKIVLRRPLEEGCHAEHHVSPGAHFLRPLLQFLRQHGFMYLATRTRILQPYFYTVGNMPRRQNVKWSEYWARADSGIDLPTIMSIVPSTSGIERYHDRWYR